MGPRIMAIVLVLAAATPGGAQVRINEFAYDDSGDDDEEFVELFNASDEPVDLGGWQLLGGTAPGVDLIYEFPVAWVLDPGQMTVVGSASVPNVEHVLDGLDRLGNGPSYVFLVDTEPAVVDAVAWETNKGTGGFPAQALVEGGIWGNHVMVASTHLSWQRWFDGRDTDVNEADFGQLPWTPGESNDRVEDIDFDSGFELFPADSALDAFPGSFVPGTVVDPNLISPSNPSVVEESPDGGLAMITWDPAGGGNFVVLDARASEIFYFESWVWIDSTPKIGDEVETWSVGVRGTSGTFYNTPILFDANGNTGVTWTYQATSAGATLYLVDEGHGGPAASRNRIAQIPIVAGENDGWQRLRLEVESEFVIARFGGSYGSTLDGEVFEAELSTPPGPGSFYIGYREALATTTPRPPLFDALVVQPEIIVNGQPLFVRGDANGDSETNLSDPVFILSNLFLGGEDPTCQSAADANDDSNIDLADPVSILNRLFLGGDALPPPNPACGIDPTADALGCGEFPPCG